MQRDLMSGRPSELEAHAGAVVRLGRAGCPHTREHVSLPQSVALGTPGAGPPRVPEVTTGLAPCPQLVAPAPLPARFAKHGGHPLPRSTTPSGHAGCRRRGEVSRKPGLRVCGLGTRALGSLRACPRRKAWDRPSHHRSPGIAGISQRPG